jgi:hypothetical protein
VNEAIENVPGLVNYDVVITPFLFDNFSAPTLQQVFSHIDQALNPGGIWLNTDFQLSGKWWQRPLLKTMLLFFKLICGIESTSLPDIEKCFEKGGYKAIDQKHFFGEFIVSTAYQK